MKQNPIKTVVVCVIAAIAAAISLLPFLYMIIQSLMPWTLVDKALIAAPTLRSYLYLTSTGGSNPFMWMRALLNSLIVSFPCAVIAVTVGLLTGYSMTKLRFAGRNLVYNSLLFQMFFPSVILLVPQYMLLKPLANNYLGMILPLAISMWAIFMYINYFTTLADEVFEAARIDGLNEFRMVTAIAMPLTKSVTSIVFLSTFMSRWNELMWDMLISPKIQMQTLNVLISTQFRPMDNLPGPLYAASTMLTVPIILLFLAFSKHFKEGINFMLK